MNWVFDSYSFVSRSHCGNWSSWLISINQLSNLLIFIVYMTISLSLVSLWIATKKNESLKKLVDGQTGIILMFVGFISFCGLTHLMDVLAFTWAPYRLFTLVDVTTAILSVPTAFVLPGVIRKIVNANTNVNK